MQIRAVAFDVDGVLTDGGFWWGPDGQEWKRFSFADIMGLSLARKAGLLLVLISGEDSPLVDRLALKMGITDVYKNCKNKADALRSFADSRHLSLQEICFMGDDINDLPALEIAGFAVAPADARSVVIEKCSYVAKAKAGNGAAREVIDLILAQIRAAAVSSTQ